MAEQTKIVNNPEPSVMLFREATDNATALEARGDFKYKGIFGLYNYVLEATNRFSTNRILPEISQLKREVPLPENKFDEYIVELTGRGSIKSPMLLMFPSIDFITSSGQISELSILCRPTQSDGVSAKRYIEFYRQKAFEALTSWLKYNVSHWQSVDSSNLYQRVMQRGIADTHAGAVIAEFFKLGFDRSPEQKMVTYRAYVRPLIQQLIDEKKILYLKDPVLNFHTIQFSDEVSLKHRIEMLVNCCATAIPDFQNPPELNIDRIEQQVDAAYQSSALNTVQKQIVAELRLCIGEYQRLQKSRKEKEQKEKLGGALADLAKQEHVVASNHFRNWPDELLQKVLSVPEVLNVEFPLNGKVFTFLLMKERIYQAVISARKNLDEKGDETEVRILSSMGISRYLEGDQLRAFEDLEDRIFFERLPFFTRLWRALFGRRRISKEESMMVKERLKKEELEEQIQIKKKDVIRTTRRLAEEQIEKKKQGSSSADDGEIPANSFEKQTEKTAQALQVDERAEEILRKVVDLLDDAWNRNEFPNRTQVLEGVSDFENNEDSMIMFLKKYGRKQIYSFRVMREDPKFIWPILISRRYIQRHGKRLLKESMDEADRQRKAIMPDQEKFDIATAIEDFLTKLMSRR